MGADPQDKGSPAYERSLRVAKRSYLELRELRGAKDWRLCLGLGKTLEKLGEHQEAQREYELAVEFAKPKLLEPLHRLRASKLKRLVALSAQGQAKTVSPTHPPASPLTGSTTDDREIASFSVIDGRDCFFNPKEDVTEALTALESQKAYPPSRYTLARAYFLLGQKTKALETIETLFTAGKNGGFRINIWEDECLQHGREESSRKLVCRVRKALSLYIECLVHAKDLQTLNAMHIYLSRNSWGQCLSDLPVIHNLFGMHTDAKDEDAEGAGEEKPADAEGKEREGEETKEKGEGKEGPESQPPQPQPQPMEIAEGMGEQGAQ